MVFIPGEVIAALTFPGVILHEAAQQLFCRFFRVAVLDVCYFRVGNPAGYVVHEPLVRPSQYIWIGVGPFLVNTLVGVVIAAPAVLTGFLFEEGDLLDYLLIWLGVSIAMHAFPSIRHAQAMVNILKARETSILTKLIAGPVVAVIYVGAVGSILWLDLIYGLVVVALLPQVVIWLLV